MTEKQHFITAVTNTAAALHCPMDAWTVSRICDFILLLKETNTTINLVSRAVTDADLVSKHMTSSLLFVQAIEGLRKKQTVKTIADVGSGGGFPGIICALCFPDISFVLIDSVGKKIRFLNEVKEKLELSNIQLINARAEDSAKKGYGKYFDVVTARALANIMDSIKFCMPLVKSCGCFVTIKSNQQQQEIAKTSHTIKKIGLNLRYTVVAEGNRMVYVSKV